MDSTNEPWNRATVARKITAYGVTVDVRKQYVYLFAVAGAYVRKITLLPSRLLCMLDT